MRISILFSTKSLPFTSYGRFVINRRFCTNFKSSESKPKTIFLEVPYEQKEDAKSKGAKWNTELKKWYITSSDDIDLFKSWTRNYIDVPYNEKDEAKSLGALWCKENHMWYYKYFNTDSSHMFNKWLPKNIKSSEVDLKPKLETINSDLQKSILFFDLETNGLPKKPGQGIDYYDYSDTSKYDSSRIVQLSCMLCQFKDLSEIESFNCIIKADGFDITNHNIHGITMEKSLSEGISFVDMVKQIIPRFFNKATFLVAHNADFDTNILKSELFRYSCLDFIKTIEKKNIICTMKTTKTLIDARNKYNKIKNPNLKELYEFATGKTIQNQHDAKYDVLNLRDAMKCLIDKKKYKFE